MDFETLLIFNRVFDRVNWQEKEGVKDQSHPVKDYEENMGEVDISLALNTLNCI